MAELGLRKRCELEKTGTRRRSLLNRKLVLIDDAPTGDVLLDETIKYALLVPFSQRKELCRLCQFVAALCNLHRYSLSSIRGFAHRVRDFVNPLLPTLPPWWLERMELRS